MGHNINKNNSDYITFKVLGGIWFRSENAVSDISDEELIDEIGVMVSTSSLEELILKPHEFNRSIIGDYVEESGVYDSDNKEEVITRVEKT